MSPQVGWSSQTVDELTPANSSPQGPPAGVGNPAKGTGGQAVFGGLSRCGGGGPAEPVLPGQGRELQQGEACHSGACWRDTPDLGRCRGSMKPGSLY